VAINVGQWVSVVMRRIRVESPMTWQAQQARREQGESAAKEVGGLMI